MRQHGKKTKNRIYSNKSLGRLKVIKGGAYSFSYLLQSSTLKTHKYTSRPSWLMDVGIWLIISWLIISKFDGGCL